MDCKTTKEEGYFKRYTGSIVDAVLCAWKLFSYNSPKYAKIL